MTEGVVYDWDRDTRPFHLRGPFDAPSARVVQVIEVRSKRGSGASEDEPVREITTYLGLDGEWLAEADPIGRIVR